MKLTKYWGRIVVAGIIGITIVVSSCTDKANDIGNELDNSGAFFNLKFTDSITVEAYSVLLDSIRTDSLARNLCGSYMDPVFGELTTGFAAKFQMEGDTPSFGTNPVIDSIIFSLSYAGYYGDTTTMQTFKIHEVDEKLEFDQNYYSTDEINFKPTLLSEKTFAPKPFSKVFVADGDTLTNDTVDALIRFDLFSLNPDFGNKLLAMESEGIYTNKEFVNYFYGLYVSAEPVTSGGSISYFNLQTGNSKVIVYYNNDETDTTQSLKLASSLFDKRFHVASRNEYSNASSEFVSQVINDNHELGNDVIYLQAMAGVDAIIKFPHLAKLREIGDIVINKAELVLEDNELGMDGYVSPSVLFLAGINEGGESEILPDQLEGEEFFGGFYEEDETEYRFRITKYVQQLINDEDAVDYGIRLSINNSAIKADRLILNGPNPENGALFSDRLRLEITYSLVND